MYGFTDKAFGLLTKLTANNKREWFKAHKDEFDQSLLDPFAVVLEAISRNLESSGIELRGGKETMFRMHRDVRFSKDKSPYKTSVSGILTRRGDKRESAGFVYLHLDTDGGFAAAGRYNLTPKALGPIRDRIIEDADRFAEILGDLNGSGRDLDRSMSLSSMPRGYAAYGEHQFADELKLKSMMVRSALSKSAWKTGDVVEAVSTLALDTRDFIDFVSV
ncbi:MAG: DUF2461 domain-containing protein [Pseudomonadota bacterium]